MLVTLWAYFAQPGTVANEARMFFVINCVFLWNHPGFPTVSPNVTALQRNSNCDFDAGTLQMWHSDKDNVTNKKMPVRFYSESFLHYFAQLRFIRCLRKVPDILGGTFDREVAVYHLVLSPAVFTVLWSCPSVFLLQWPTFSVVILHTVEWLCHWGSKLCLKGDGTCAMCPGILWAHLLGCQNQMLVPLLDS